MPGDLGGGHEEAGKKTMKSENGTWLPLMKCSEDTWLGKIDRPGIWMGTEATARRPVNLDDPVYAWPLLEKNAREAQDELKRHWEEFSLQSMSWKEFILALVSSTVTRGRPYWVQLSLTWLGAMSENDEFNVSSIIDLLLQIAESDLPQHIRHRAWWMVHELKQRRQ